MLNSSGPYHRVILTAPSAGWSFRLDQTRRALNSSDIYVTAREPNPAFMHAQSLVMQEVATPLDSARPVQVFARVLAHDQLAEGVPFRPVSLRAEPPPAIPDGPGTHPDH